MTTTYARETHARRDGNPCCHHCGLVPRQHHSDRRCYSEAERNARRRFALREGRWPEQDEGCEEPLPVGADDRRRLLKGLAYGLGCLAVGVVWGWVLWALLAR
jgi:hypothetical protein